MIHAIDAIRAIRTIRGAAVGLVRPWAAGCAIHAIHAIRAIRAIELPKAQVREGQRPRGGPELVRRDHPPSEGAPKENYTATRVGLPSRYSP